MELEDWLKWKGIEETSTPVSLAKDRMIISAENEQGQRKALKGIICMLEELLRKNNHSPHVPSSDIHTDALHGEKSTPEFSSELYWAVCLVGDLLTGSVSNLPCPWLSPAGFMDLLLHGYVVQVFYGLPPPLNAMARTGVGPNFGHITLRAVRRDAV